MPLKSRLVSSFREADRFHRIRLVAAVLFLSVLFLASMVGSLPRSNAGNAAAPTPASPFPAISHITKEPGPEVPTFYQVLDKARGSCPASRPALLLEDNGADTQSALAVASYNLYPIRVQAALADEPRTSVDPASGGWGCVLTFGSKGAPLLLPYRDALEELACSVQGCAYRVR